MLDQRAASGGLSRSQLIRESIEAHLADDHEAEISAQIIAGYERTPQSTPDDWGEVSELVASSARHLHPRLDAEERAARHPPW